MAAPAPDLDYEAPEPSQSRRGVVRWFGETRGGRRSLVGLAVAMALVGVGFLAYPWLTDVYTNEVVQRRLRADFSRPEVRVAYERREIAVGDGLTRIVIPRLGVDTIVVEGVTPSALKAGAGHYPESPLPGEAGNMAIAGHRTTYGKPFADIDQLEPGDEIHLETPVGYHIYRVSGSPFVSGPTDRSVLEPTSHPTLTLTTCHPRGSAAQRLIVHAAIDPNAGQRIGS